MHLFRRTLLILLINIGAVAITAAIIPGINYDYGLTGLFFVAVILGLVNLLIKPILKLFALPVEILTIGLFGLVINTGMLLLVDYLLPEFKITGYPFPGATLFQSFIIPPFMMPSWGTALTGSILIGFITSFLLWLTKSK